LDFILFNFEIVELIDSYEGLSVLMKDDESGLLYYTGSTVPSTQSYNASAGLDYDSLIKYLLSTAQYCPPPLQISLPIN
jgi:hypothetical protein